MDKITPKKVTEEMFFYWSVRPNHYYSSPEKRLTQLYRWVLEAISQGHGEPAKLAKAALTQPSPPRADIEF